MGMPAGPGGGERVIGLFAATSIGVAAIIGGGILALAGAAFASAGPAATLAIALNGVIALITAASFAELSTAFPQSGGAYIFANKVLSIRAAFAVGWVLWFAYIVACVLYALGFGAFGVLLIQELFRLADRAPPGWLGSHAAMVLLAGAATGYFVLMLTRHVSGGGNWINVAKVGIFAVVIAAGVFALVTGRAGGDATAHLTPFLSGRVTGLLHAMGLTFVLLHGFEVIAAIGGEVVEPSRVIPRAMFLSVAISLAIYLPMMFLVSTAGVPDGSTLDAFSRETGDTMVAAAVHEFMGPVGTWLVIAVAVLAFLSALRANIMAGSRMALSMARDRALPAALARIDERRKTPVVAVYATGIAVVVILFALPDLEAAGAAASLIFLVSFALVHVTAYLARKRAAPAPGVYRTGWFPLVPGIGVVSCAGLAAFEAIAVPEAGRIALMWLGFGVILYFALFRTHAEISDAAAERLDPGLGRLRGKDELVVVPIASPASARALVEVAHALAPSEYARVLLLSVVSPERQAAGDPRAALADAQKVLNESLGTSLAAGYPADALISIAGDSWARIRQVAHFHECECLLLGLGQLPAGEGALSPQLEELIDGVDCDVAIMRVPEGWRLGEARRIVVPIGGKGDEHKLRARVLGSLCRTGARDVHFVTAMSGTSSQAEREDRRAQIDRLARSHVAGRPTVEVVCDDDPVAALARATAGADLVVLGLRGDGGRRRVTSRISLAIASQASCASLLLSSRRPLAAGDLYRPIRGVLGAIGGQERAGNGRIAEP